MTQHMRLLDAFSQGHAEQPDLASWRDSDVLLQLVLHTADLCNPCRKAKFSISWGELICKEFLEQVEIQSHLHIANCCHKWDHKQGRRRSRNCLHACLCLVGWQAELCRHCVAVWQVL